MMKTTFLVLQLILLLCVLSCLFLCLGDKDGGTVLFYDFEDGNTDDWRPKNPEHWRIVQHDGANVYELTDAGEQGLIRAPTSWSVLAGQDVSGFELSGRFKCKQDTAIKARDLCIFFHFQDAHHFYYAHFSAKSDNVHNIIALVNGDDRVKINNEAVGKSISRLSDFEWHTFKITYDEESGEILAFIDDLGTPVLTAQDKTLSHGSVGVGSFDDTGYFDDIRLWKNSR